MAIYLPERSVRRPRIDFWLVAVICLSAALVALGGWVVLDRYAGSSDSDATQIIDELNAAANAVDAEAARELYARDAVFEIEGKPIRGLDRIVGTVIMPGGVGLHLERVGPVATAEEWAAAFVRWGDTGLELGLFRIEDGKIVRQRVVLLGGADELPSR